MRTVPIYALLALVALDGAAATVAPRVPAAEATIIRETYRMAEELGEEIWPGFSSVPFPIVLIDGEVELLIGWDGPPPDGFSTFDDGALGAVSFRPRVFSPGLSAAFPAFGSPSVVVIGTLESTAKTPGQWALTLLHEHFHQLQYESEGYQADVAGLDLAGDDTSGMWMLEYPFPYGDEKIESRFGELTAALGEALRADAETSSSVGAEEPWAAFQRLLDALEPADRRYLSFQLWQEGVSRFVELEAAEILATSFEPGDEFLALDGFSGWNDEAAAQRRRITDELGEVSLATAGRVAFYPVGAALAMLLERRDPAWKSRYEEPRFALASYASPARGVEITYLANEGFLLAAGDDKVLIDALFPGIDGYAKVPPAVVAKLQRGEPPFDGVDLVLATHFHRDHFGAAEVARFLGSSRAVFVSTPDAVALLMQATDRVDAAAQHPGEGMRSVVSVDRDLRVTVLNLHHGRSRPEVQNLGFVVEIGGVKVLHVGDTEVTVDDLEPYDLASNRIDVALLPSWLVADPSWRPVVEEIGARHLVVMHLVSADAPVSWFGAAGSRAGWIRSLQELYPEAWIPDRALDSRRYVPAPR